MNNHAAAAIGVAIALSHVPVARADPAISAAFGNTIQSTYPDGRQGDLWIQPGGVYEAKGRRGQDTSGRWRMSGDRLCLSQQRPFPAPFQYCTSVPERFQGAWEARAPTGERIVVTLQRGHVVGRKGQPRR